jgi:hypothetical protein
MFTDADYPADPYPGARPDCSFLHTGSTGWPLRRSAGKGWQLADGTGLDDWLTGRGEPGLAGRVPVLTYGSNRSPGKLGWLRATLGLRGSVPVLRAHCTGLAAVWASALRVRDGQRPATLAAAPGVTETHAIWLASPAQVRVLDVCEGRGERYRLARLESGEIRFEDGSPAGTVLVYVAASAIRLPLLVDGAVVRCADVGQAAAQLLTGVPGPDGLAAVTVPGDPDPADWW